MAKGTSRQTAIVCASSVFPLPVGPSRRMFDFSSLMSSSAASRRKLPRWEEEEEELELDEALPSPPCWFNAS